MGSNYKLPITWNINKGRSKVNCLDKFASHLIYHIFASLLKFQNIKKKYVRLARSVSLKSYLSPLLLRYQRKEIRNA